MVWAKDMDQIIYYKLQWLRKDTAMVQKVHFIFYAMLSSLLLFSFPVPSKFIYFPFLLFSFHSNLFHSILKSLSFHFEFSFIPFRSFHFISFDPIPPLPHLAHLSPYMSSSSDKPTILIVGAGLGGLMLGALLEKSGVPYQIFERAAAVKPLGTSCCIGIS
jgi:hypothetical protein